MHRPDPVHFRLRTHRRRPIPWPPIRRSILIITLGSALCWALIATPLLLLGA